MSSGVLAVSRSGRRSPGRLERRLFLAWFIVAWRRSTTGERAVPTLGSMDQDGYWLASVTDSHGTRELAREVDYDDALAEISDEIAHRPDVDHWQRRRCP